MSETDAAPKIEKCRWCSQPHGGVCPFVAAIEFHPDGISVKRVEFHEPQPVVTAGGQMPKGVWPCS